MVQTPLFYMMILKELGYYHYVRNYVSPEPTFGTSGAEETVTAIDMTLSANSCAGPCSIAATVTWQNPGTSSITFTPAILIDSTTLVYGTIMTIPAGGTNYTTITTTTLSLGNHTICPYPN